MNHKIISSLVALIYIILLPFFLIGVLSAYKPDTAPFLTKFFGWAIVIGLGYGAYIYYRWAHSGNSFNPSKGNQSSNQLQSDNESSTKQHGPNKHTVSERLQRIENLYEEKVISSQEREAKRREILNDI